MESDSFARVMMSGKGPTDHQLFDGAVARTRAGQTDFPLPAA